jgi:lipoprotein-anchoring transpeptidase ErfK/SrfK
MDAASLATTAGTIAAGTKCRSPMFFRQHSGELPMLTISRAFVVAGALALPLPAGAQGQALNTLVPDSIIADTFDEQHIAPELVEYLGNEKPGTIVIVTEERRLYFVQDDGTAIRYVVGVGRPGFDWRGANRISAKAEWPDWRPPAEMLKRRPDLPRFMEGGPDNPLGARALYLGSTLYRIHGSNEPGTLGAAVSSGCIRMHNDDVIDLYERVKVGTRVVVY